MGGIHTTLRRRGDVDDIDSTRRPLLSSGAASPDTGTQPTHPSSSTGDTPDTEIQSTHLSSTGDTPDTEIQSTHSSSTGDTPDTDIHPTPTPPHTKMQPTHPSSSTGARPTPHTEIPPTHPSSSTDTQSMEPPSSTQDQHVIQSTHSSSATQTQPLFLSHFRRLQQWWSSFFTRTSPPSPAATRRPWFMQLQLQLRSAHTLLSPVLRSSALASSSHGASTPQTPHLTDEEIRLWKDDFITVMTLAGVVLTVGGSIVGLCSMSAKTPLIPSLWIYGIVVACIITVTATLFCLGLCILRRRGAISPGFCYADRCSCCDSCCGCL